MDTIKCIIYYSYHCINHLLGPNRDLTKIYPNNIKMNIYKNLDNHYIKYRKYIIHVLFDKYNKVWFNAIDTALALGYTNTRKAIRSNVNKKDRKQLKKITAIGKVGHSNYLSGYEKYTKVYKNHKNYDILL